MKEETFLRATVRVCMLALAAAVPFVPADVRAEIVHESSSRNPGASDGGFLLGGGSGWVRGARFHLDATTEIQSGGGRVTPFFGDPDTLQVSIVALGMSGLPSGTTSAMTTLVSATAPSPTTDGDLVVPLPITLPPGDYGIVVSALDPASMSTVMPDQNTNNPDASYFGGTSEGWFDGTGINPGYYPRLVVYNGCGNSVLADDETCDDGNTDPDDGCDTICRDLCGDFVIGLSEECEDGDTDSTDCCDSGCNLPAVASCVVPGAGSFSVTDTTPDEKDKLQWKWQKGGAVDLADFGNPATTTSYVLCVDRDRGGDRPASLGAISLSSDAAWTGGEKFWTLKDKTGAAGLGGIAGGKLKPGVAGKSSIGLKGAGALLPSLPIAAGDQVTVTLRTLGGGACWTSGAMPVVKKTDTKTTVALP